MKKEKCFTLLKKIRRAGDRQELSQIFQEIEPKQIRRPSRVAFVNAHALNLSWRDQDFIRNLIECDFIFRDGSGMKILFKLLGCNPGLNLNGTDLIPQIVELYEGKKVLLFGTEEPYLSRAADIINKRAAFVSTMDGFQDEVAYLEAAKAQPSPLIILAMGMPKQERVAKVLADNLDYPCLIVCGGAILDFLGGKVTRAPLIYRRLGMEWFFRLTREPKRLFRRYVIGNFLFLFRGFLLAFSSNRPI